MIRVDTSGPVGDNMASWRTRAQKARDKAIRLWRETGKVPKPNPEIWKDLKEQFLNELFHWKCAYCEGKFPAHAALDVEHYRPKGKVTEGGDDVEHPGYFWLAYEWHNLILACRNCNSGHSTTPENGDKVSHLGKACEFPVEGERVRSPSDSPEQWLDELETERPLLLHPYFDDPEEHISFDSIGCSVGTTDRGNATIKACDLNRVALIDERVHEGELCRTQLCRMVLTDGANVSPLDSSARFSAWRKSFIRRKVAEIVKISEMKLAPDDSHESE
jgi:5-methylcytosine-specific restriction endonuclease McrA